MRALGGPVDEPPHPRHCPPPDTVVGCEETDPWWQGSGSWTGLLFHPDYRPSFRRPSPHVSRFGGRRERIRATLCASRVRGEVTLTGRGGGVRGDRILRRNRGPGRHRVEGR